MVETEDLTERTGVSPGQSIPSCPGGDGRGGWSRVFVLVSRGTGDSLSWRGLRARGFPDVFNGP
jgi:hypothetical protein